MGNTYTYTKSYNYDDKEMIDLAHRFVRFAEGSKWTEQSYEHYKQFMRLFLKLYDNDYPIKNPVLEEMFNKFLGNHSNTNKIKVDWNNFIS